MFTQADAVKICGKFLGHSVGRAMSVTYVMRKFCRGSLINMIAVNVQKLQKEFKQTFENTRK